MLCNPDGFFSVLDTAVFVYAELYNLAYHQDNPGRFTLGLAVLMNHRHLKGTITFRSLFYMPYIVPFVAAVFLWGGMLNPATGWVNRFLRWVGVANENLPLWANSGAGEWGWIYATYVIMGIWGIGNAMLIMIAGLQGVPTELYPGQNPHPHRTLWG